MDFSTVNIIPINHYKFCASNFLFFIKHTIPIPTMSFISNLKSTILILFKITTNALVVTVTYWKRLWSIYRPPYLRAYSIVMSKKY